MPRHTSIKLDTPCEFINITPLNPLISKCQIKVCYVGDEPNRNRSVITKDVARQMANSLPGSPIVGYYNEKLEDFEEHNHIIELSNGEFRIKENTRPYGFVDLNAKVWFQKFLDDGIHEREYMMTEGYLWTGQYEEAQRIIDKGNNQSMELDEDTLNAVWTRDDKGKPKFFIINEAIISKLCILGEECEPCFEGADITAPTIHFSLDDGFKNQLFSMMQELKDLITKGGAKVFTRYNVEIGDALWTALYAHITEKYSEYGLEGVYEEDGQLFAILSCDNKYSRLNFSMTETEFSAVEEIVELEYTPDVEPQFSPEAIAEYADKKKKEEEEDKNNSDDDKKSEDKSEEEKDDEVEDDEDKKKKKEFAKDEDEDKEEICPECGKPISQCECEQKKTKCALETLQAEYSALEEKYNSLVSEKETLDSTIAELKAFKLAVEKKEKEEMINTQFYMLSDEDKKDVLDNIDTYSLNDIESKLSIICVRNKVSFEDMSDNNDKKDPMTYNLSGGSNASSAVPAWVQAALEVAKTM